MTWTDFVVRGTLVLAAGFAAVFAWRRAAAAVRHMIWLAVFVALLALPLVLVVGPKIAVFAWPAAAMAPRAVAAVPVVVDAVAAVAPAASRDYVLPLYLVGVLMVALRFAGGAVRTVRLVRQTKPAHLAQAMADELRRELGMARVVRVVESSAAGVPMTWSAVRPVVVLPQSWREWPGDRLHAVLLHELIHVRRRDLAAQMAAQAACGLYWFHPLAWLAARDLRNQREQACDDAVLSTGVAATDYAGHLLELARGMVARRSLADAPAMAESGDLEERVRVLLDGSRNRRPLSRPLAAAVAMVTCALMLPVSMVTLKAETGGGMLAGKVQDASQARVPNAQVRIKNLDARNEEMATADIAGEFKFANIPPGRYSIEARSRGFAVGTMEVPVEAGRAAEAVVTLRVGQVSESMVIAGARPAGAGAKQEPAPARLAPVRIAVGGNVQPAKLLRQVHPVYPADLKAQGIGGNVVVKAVISVTGEILNPEVVSASVHPALAQAALDAIRQWKYEPTLLNGKPVEAETTIMMGFELEK